MEEGTVPNSIYESRITLTQKPDIQNKERKQEIGTSYEIFFLIFFILFYF